MIVAVGSVVRTAWPLATNRRACRGREALARLRRHAAAHLSMAALIREDYGKGLVPVLRALGPACHGVRWRVWTATEAGEME